MRAGSVLFTGTVVSVGPERGPKHSPERDVVFRVEEAFAGLPRGAEEVTVVTRGELPVGAAYLVDAVNGDDKRLRLVTCGSTGEVSSRWIADFLEFLSGGHVANVNVVDSAGRGPRATNLRRRSFRRLN